MYIRTILELTAMLGIVFLVAVFALTAGAQDIPAMAADANGLVGRYGMRVVLTWIFLLGSLLICLVFLISRFPKLQRFPVVITAGNIEIQYMFMKIMLSAIQIVFISYFLTMMVNVYKATIELASPDFLKTTVAAVVACVAIWVIYYIAARRRK